MLRTTENKIYRQSTDPKELSEGFARAETLFLVSGARRPVEATYFTPMQRELIVSSWIRGGGLLPLGGRFARRRRLGRVESADLLPVVLPDAKGTFHVAGDGGARARRRGQLHHAARHDRRRTPSAGSRCRPDDFQVRHAQTGATVLADMSAGGRKMPMFIIENFTRAHGRASSTGTWRWQMNLPARSVVHALRQQLLRWLVTGSPGHVTASVPNQVLLMTAGSRCRLTSAATTTSPQPMRGWRRISSGSGGVSNIDGAARPTRRSFLAE
jgi:hypothetical protein